MRKMTKEERNALRLVRMWAQKATQTINDGLNANDVTVCDYELIITAADKMAEHVRRALKIVLRYDNSNDR